jgi:PleD family two-component response regulator
VTERSFAARKNAPVVPAPASAPSPPMESDPGPDTDPIRVLIADDHALFRRGLEMVLQGEPGLELVGQASDGQEAVQLAGEVVPDVVLMDIRMPKMTGIEVPAR